MSLLNFHQSAVDTKRWKSPIKSEVESQKAWCFRIWCIFKNVQCSYVLREISSLHLNRLYQVVIWQGLIEKEWNLYAFKDKDNEGTYIHTFLIFEDSTLILILLTYLLDTVWKSLTSNFWNNFKVGSWVQVGRIKY